MTSPASHLLPHPGHGSLPYPFFPALLLALLLVGCSDPAPGPAEEAIQRSIETHGGEAFQTGVMEFDFRGDRFLLARHDDRFRQERVHVDPEGRVVREQMTNEGTRLLLDGREVTLDEEERAELELAVNSVIYFAFLPHRLRDPGVRAAHLGETRIRDEPYDVVEVTFDEAQGGEDWEDRFVYWIHSESGTLDWMAYRYERDDGGTRFRRAVNRREVGPLLVQDWENWDGGDRVSRLEDYPDLHAAGELELVSMVEMENLTWIPSTPADTDPDAPGPDLTSTLDGLQLDVGLESATWTAGEEVTIRIGLANRSSEDRTLTFPTSQRYDLVLLDPEDEEVARWSRDRSFLQVLGEETVRAGEEGPVWTETWTIPEDRTGPHRLVVELPASPAGLRTGVDVEIVER